MKFLKHFIILFNITFLFLLPLFFGGFYESHDSETHIIRAIEYRLALLDGQFPPRWAGQANYGFGSPYFIFYYPLPGYLMAILNQIGMPLENTFLTMIIISFLAGPIFFYLWISQIFDKRTAFFSSIIYLTLPYRFLVMYVRGGIGELLAFSIIPLIFYFIEKSKEKITLNNFLLASFTYLLLVLSHNAISFIFTPLFLIYGSIRSRSSAIFSLLIMFFGLMLSSYFWIPSLYEAKYTNGLFYFGNMYKNHFSDLLKLIYSPWGFGPDVNQAEGLSPQIGIIPIFIIFLSLFIYKRKSISILFWFGVFLGGVFLSTSYSSFIWEKIDFLKKFQFPWRFAVLPSFAAAAITPYLFNKLKNIKIVYAIIIASLIFSTPFVGVKKHVTYQDNHYYSYNGSTYFHNEATTLWTEGDPNKEALKQVEIIAGQGEVKNLKIKSNIHSFDVTAKTQLVILDNTIYFPGWTAKVNGKNSPIQFQDINHKGFITFPIPLGKSKVEVVFEETQVRKISDILSLIGFTGFALLLLFMFVLMIKKHNSCPKNLS